MGGVPEGYTICPRCKRLTPTYSGYCQHCGYPLYQSRDNGETRAWDIYLGKDGRGERQGILLKDLSRSLLVYGVVGYGKTTLVVRLLRESITYNVGFVILDYEGEYSEYADTLNAKLLVAGGTPRLGLDIFSVPLGRNWKSHSEWLYSILSLMIREEGWNVTPQMEYVLKKAVRRLVKNQGSPRDLPRIIEEESRGLPAWQQTYSALTARLSRIIDGPLTEIFEPPDTLGVPLYPNRYIVDLSPISQGSSLDARIVALAVIYRIRQSMMAREPNKRRIDTLVVVEESEELLASGMPSTVLIRELIQHGRKRGLGVIIVSHSPSLIDKSILNMTGNFAVHRLDTHVDAEIAANLLGDPSLELRIRSLGTGEVLIKTASNNKPVELKVEPVAKKDDVVMLIESILKYPYLTMRERRSYLAWDGVRFKRVVDEAIRRGIVKRVSVYTGLGRPVKLLQIRGMNPSAPHSYAVHRLRTDIVEVTGTTPRENRYSGPDLEFEYHGVKIAIEVETGSNLSLAKIESRLISHDYLFLVCTSRLCMKTARRLRDSSRFKDRIILSSINGFKSKLKNLLYKK